MNPLQRKPRLSYCSNVHPFNEPQDHFAELLKTHNELQTQLENFDYGHGLWIPASLLKEPSALNLLSDNYLQDTKTDVFTLNGFPFQKFHSEKIKAEVYQPDLNERSRVEYLKSLISYLAKYLDGKGVGSVSTLPIGYSKCSKILPQTFEHLNEIGLHLKTTFETFGKKITLGLELEPDGVLQNTSEAKQFFLKLYNEYPYLSEYIGVCVDTCHLAVNFEDSSEIQKNLKGILISKVQVSNALKTTHLERLRPFCEPVYLHQTRFLPKNGSNVVVEFSDLDSALASKYKDAEGEWRVHYHVPIHWQGDGDLLTTQNEMLETLKLFIGPMASLNVEHFEIETYTHQVMPDFLKTTLSTQIKNEILWLDQCLTQ